MNEAKTEFLYSVTIRIGEMMDIGNTFRGHRRIIKSTGGFFEGPKVKGEVLPGGGDWSLLRPDGVFEGDVRDTYRTDDGHLIIVYYRAIINASPAIWEKIFKNESVDPSEYYFRATPCFETGSEKYGWLNWTVAIAYGKFSEGGSVSYDVFALQ